MTEKSPKGFASAKKKAKEYVKDKEKAERLINEAFQKAKANQGQLKDIWGNLTVLFHLIKAWVTREYKEVPVQTMLFAIGAVIYFLNPFDLIPDFLLGGYVDDAGVVAFVIKSIFDDIEKFKKWEKAVNGVANPNSKERARRVDLKRE